MRAVVLILALLIVGIAWWVYTAQTPPKPSVVVVRPANATPQPQPQLQPQLQQPSTYCNATLFKTPSTTLCGRIISVALDPSGFYNIVADRFTISGDFMFTSPPQCPVSTRGGYLVVPCMASIVTR